MIVVGKTDAFERKYMEKFRLLASEFGEFVNYEHDRGARDIGLHLTHKLNSGKERLSTAFCWFQMKGIMESTLPASIFESQSEVKLSLQVKHLRYWYLQPMPTYLVVYIESADRFLGLNIQQYVTDKWGKDILRLDQKTATIYVATDSELDEQAFSLILTKSEFEEWRKVLEVDEEGVRICRRDYDLIWHIGTAFDRNVEHRIIFMDWQSKNRAQLYIEERGRDATDEWCTLREHWQYSMNVFDLESVYPYLGLYAIEPDEGTPWLDGAVDENDGTDVPYLMLANGDVVHGEDAAGEYFEYQMGVRLNEIGEEMFEWVTNLERIGLIEITPDNSEIISVAPWHRREV